MAGQLTSYGFLSTLSLRRATQEASRWTLLSRFLSTLSLRRATHSIRCAVHRQKISIHALLAESDYAHFGWDAGADLFLSTLSLRRATRYGRPVDVQFVFLSTLSLRRATDIRPPNLSSMSISIHALLAESDLNINRAAITIMEFLSTLSLRRATALVLCSSGGVSDFYPRSPCGERRRCRCWVLSDKEFLSTLSLRRATGNCP